MGFFSRFKKEKGTENNDVKASSVNTNTGISLEKRVETVSKICLTKNINNITAEVLVVCDYSGSMNSLYVNGKVQDALERLLPLALKFDDDGNMPFYIFSDKYNKLKAININNYKDYIKNEKVLNKYSMGGTNYSPVIKEIAKTHSDTKVPTFVIFITDGDCWDKKESEDLIKEASDKSIFWQFVGIGNASFSFLQSLDDIGDRTIDNADFFSVNSIESLTDEELYTKLLGEFPDWLTAAKNKSII